MDHADVAVERGNGAVSYPLDGMAFSNRPKMSQDVHVLPLARDVDRAVLPFLGVGGNPPSLHAHRIVLLVPEAPSAARIAAKVERALRAVAVVERQDLA